jgi:hypothetical protein
VEKALEIFRDMIRRGCERNVITYSSLISVRGRSRRARLAAIVPAKPALHVTRRVRGWGGGGGLGRPRLRAGASASALPRDRPFTDQHTHTAHRNGRHLA